MYVDEHDLCPCPIEGRGRKALLQRARSCPLPAPDSTTLWGRGADLFEHVRAIGTGGIVSKQPAQATPEWCKSKCHASDGVEELGPGRLEALNVAVGQVCFGFAGKGLWAIVDLLRADQRVEAAGFSGSAGNRMHVVTRHVGSGESVHQSGYGGG